MRGFEDLPPWSANEWFDQPTEVVIVGDGTVKQLCPQDPQRVIVVFGLVTGGGGATIGLDPTFANGGTVSIGALGVPVIFTHHDHGVLVQMPWFALLPLGTNVSVITVRLRDWPDLPPDNIG